MGCMHAFALSSSFKCLLHLSLPYLSFFATLLQVADTFAAQKNNPVVPKNAAPHSGSLAWVRGLKERVMAPLEKLKGLSPAVLASDVGLEMQRQSEDLLAAMDAFEASLMQQWCGLATVVSAEVVPASAQVRGGQDSVALGVTH